MQIPNVNISFPNTVAPFSSVVAHTGAGVTKDILSSSFSPLSETSELSSSQNSLSNDPVVYSPESLVRSSTSSAPINNTGAPSLAERGPDESIRPNGTIIPETSQPIPPEQDASSSQIAVGEGAKPSVANENGGDESKAEEQVFNGLPKASADPQASGGLTVDELAVVRELSSRDQEVRTHEQQHQSVGGQHAGSASFSFQTGPDGVQYAVGGEVSIDVSSVSGNPRATIDKMRTVQAAALAPAEPSSQDRSVAAAASRLMLQAQSELAAQQTEERQIQTQKGQEQRIQAAEDRELQKDEQKDRRTSVSEAVRTYERLVGLGQQFENGLTPAINLDEVV